METTGTNQAEADAAAAAGGGGGSVAPAAGTPGPKKVKAPSVPMRLPHRVADYFLVVGGIRQEQDQQQPTAATSSSDHPDVESKQSRKQTKLVWSARVLDRYPRTDHADAEFPKDLEMFCFPSSTYELSAICHTPEPHCFVLTEADGTRVYACCLRFWEPLDEGRLAALERGLRDGFEDDDADRSQMAAARVSVAGPHPPMHHQQQSPAAGPRATVVDKKGSSTSGLDQSGQIVYAPKAFVLLSHWPFYTNFERFLSTLHRNVYVNSDGNLVPIERVLMNFIYEIPLPPRGKFEVEARPWLNPFLNFSLNSCPWNPMPGGLEARGGAQLMGKQPFLFWRPPPNKASLRDFPLSALFRWLSIDNVFTLYAAVLTEKRILFVSDKLHKLTIAAESITYLLCPFYWRHIYIPLLPARLTDFVCAPMPYIVGVQRINMPDELMLDGTIVVDLDANTISASSSASGADSPLTPLPSERQASLYRHLKKMVPDTTQPLKPGQTMADGDIEVAFLKFHVRLFANYRDYLEAPSEVVIDKFRKADFIRDHSEKGAFLGEFLETQMWQCFVDDRYDQSTRALAGGGKGAAAVNFEVLFFDETIDLACGRPAPFLQDSSQNISASARVVALAPSAEGLSKGALYKYITMPIPMSAALFGQPRDVKDLAGGQDQASSFGPGGGRRLGVDMEKISFKFFQEKRLYSQHFHTLRLRSAKQDTTFKGICAYFRGEQAVGESMLKEWEKAAAVTVDKDTPDTGTTIDLAWLRLRRTIQEELSGEMDQFRLVREEVALPLYACCSSREHQLKMLFAEANTIEAKAARGKSVVERAKATSIASFQRYEGLKETMRQRILTPSEISRIVAAQNDSEDSRLDLDESETSFHTIVAEYEQRMPQIIAAIRQLNKERIVQLKSSLTAWVQARRAHLLAQLSQLDTLGLAVEAIDGERDLVAFSEGTTDFWAAATRGSTAMEAAVGRASGVTGDQANTATAASAAAAAAAAVASQNGASGAAESSAATVAAAASSATNAPPTAIGTPVDGRAPLASPSPLPSPSSQSVTLVVSSSASGSTSTLPSPSSTSSSASLCYPLHLWGIDGFERAASQASLTRKVMKEMVLVLSGWAEVTDFKSKKLTSLVRALPEVPALTSGQRNLWEALKSRSTSAARCYGEFQLCLLKLVSDLNLTKGELKMSIVRFREHRAKLEKEVAAANDVLLRSLEKKERTARALTLLQRAQAANPTPSNANSSSSGGIGSANPNGGAASSASGSSLQSGQYPSASSLRTPPPPAGGVLSSGAYPSAASLRAGVTSPSTAGGSSSGGGGPLGSGAYPSAGSMRSGGMGSIAVGGGGGGLSEAMSPSNSSSSLGSGSGAAGLVSQKQLEQQGLALERCQKDAKEAAHEHTLNVRNSQAIQRKHDICVSRLLRLFEKKERYCLGEMKKALHILADSFHSLLILQSRKGDELLKDAVKKVDLQQEMREFVEGVAGKIPPPPSTGPPPLPPGTNVIGSPLAAQQQQQPQQQLVDFGRHLGPHGYAPAASLLQNHIAFLRSTHHLLEELSNTDDLECKGLKKNASLRIKSPRAGTTLQASTAALDQLIDRLSEITEDNVRASHDVAQPFSKLKSSLKALAKAHDQRQVEIEKAYRKAADEKERADGQLSAAEDNLKLAHAKAEQAVRDSEGGGDTQRKGLFSSLMSTPLKDLQSKEAQAMKEVERARAQSSEKDAGLMQAQAKRASEMRTLLQDMQATDVKRWNSQSELLNALVTKHALHVDKCQTLVHNFSQKVVSLSVEGDIADFLTKHATAASSQPPEWVAQDYFKYSEIVEQNRAEAARAKDAAARQAELQAKQEQTQTQENGGAASGSGGGFLSPSDGVAPSSPLQARLPLPTTHHGYSNSTSMTHTHTRQASHVPAAAIPPPPAPITADGLTPMRRVSVFAKAGAAPGVAAGSGSGPPPLPSILPGVVRPRASVTNSSGVELSQSESSTTMSAAAAAASPGAHPTTVATPSSLEPSTNMYSTSGPTGTTTAAAAAAAAQPSNEAKGEVYEFSASRSSTTAAVANASMEEDNGNGGGGGGGGAATAEEFQDENGDWLQRHTNTSDSCVLDGPDPLAAIGASTDPAAAATTSEEPPATGEPLASLILSPSTSQIASPVPSNNTTAVTPAPPGAAAAATMADDSAEEVEEELLVPSTAPLPVVVVAAPSTPKAATSLPISKPMSMPPPLPAVLPGVSLPAAASAVSTSVAPPGVGSPVAAPALPRVVSSPTSKPFSLPPSLPSHRPKGPPTLRGGSLSKGEPEGREKEKRASTSSASSSSSSSSQTSTNAPTSAPSPVAPQTAPTSMTVIDETESTAEPDSSAPSTSGASTFTPVIVGSMLDGGDSSSSDDETPLTSPSHHHPQPPSFGVSAGEVTAAASEPKPSTPPPETPPYTPDLAQPAGARPPQPPPFPPQV